MVIQHKTGVFRTQLQHSRQARQVGNIFNVIIGKPEEGRIKGKNKTSGRGQKAEITGNQAR